MRCANCGQDLPQRGPVSPDCSAATPSAWGLLVTACFLLIGSGLLRWWVEGSREPSIGLGSGFALAVIVTAITIHYRRTLPAATRPHPLGEAQSDLATRREQLQGLKESGRLVAHRNESKGVVFGVAHRGESLNPVPQ